VPPLFLTLAPTKCEMACNYWPPSPLREAYGFRWIPTRRARGSTLCQPKSTCRQRADASNDRCFQFAEGLPDMSLVTPKGWRRRTESHAFNLPLSVQRIYYVSSQRQSTIRTHEYHKPENSQRQCSYSFRVSFPTPHKRPVTVLDGSGQLDFPCLGDKRGIAETYRGDRWVDHSGVASSTKSLSKEPFDFNCEGTVCDGHQAILLYFPLTSSPSHPSCRIGPNFLTALPTFREIRSWARSQFLNRSISTGTMGLDHQEWFDSQLVLYRA
jgi:hypothetical protein